MGYVYVYFTKEKECKYIGQSVDWKRRFYQHCKTDMINTYKLIDSIVVIRCGRNKMSLIESYLINKYLPEWNKAIPQIPKEKVNINHFKKFYVPIKDII